jgi:hypothetical protein
MLHTSQELPRYAERPTVVRPSLTAARQTMDSLTRWSAQLVDLRTLFSEWERRRLAGAPWTRRFREIHSVCMFTLCIENGTDKRYLIGFPQRGIQSPVRVKDLFDGDFGEIEDTDVVLVDDPKKHGESEGEHHRCQLVSYKNQPSTSEVDVVAFLERKKLRVAPDNDLRLVIHVEAAGFMNHAFLATYLAHRKPPCPYSQVFVFGQTSESPRVWSCALIYPGFAKFADLEEETAKALVLDRDQYSR